MALVTILELSGEAQGKAHYVERAVGQHELIVGTLSIESWALPRPAPQTVRVVVDFLDAVPPRERLIPPSATVCVTAAIKTGDLVTVVKDKTSDVKSPPPWLEEYLGRTGTVLWASTDGAMVRLDHQATWFSYSELELAE